MSATCMDCTRLNVGKDQTRFSVWRWPADDEFPGGYMSLSSGSWALQTSLTPDDMRAMAKALLTCADGVEAEMAAAKVAA